MFDVGKVVVPAFESLFAIRITVAKTSFQRLYLSIYGQVSSWLVMVKKPY